MRETTGNTGYMAKPETTILTSINILVRFLLEIAALTIFGYWGYSIGDARPIKLGLAIGGPLLIVLAFGMIGSARGIGQIWRVLLELLVLGGAAVVLHALDRPLYAIAFALVAAINTVQLYWMSSP
ncbi:MAG: YrdB family protein [Halobacteriaceae archaeon]